MAPHSSYGTVGPPFWPEVWIIGSGPSRERFDTTRLLQAAISGCAILAVNDAYAFLAARAIPCAARFSLDPHWVRRHRALLSLGLGEQYVAVPLETWPEVGGIPGVMYLRRSHADGLSDDPGVIATGCHSGYGALNLAYLKGAPTIHLVGYDLVPHAGAPKTDPYASWARHYDATVPQLNARGVMVYNHNLESGITAFPKVL